MGCVQTILNSCVASGVQGDSLSPYLFLLAVETLAIAIRANEEITGMVINQEVSVTGMFHRSGLEANHFKIPICLSNLHTVYVGREILPFFHNSNFQAELIQVKFYSCTHDSFHCGRV